MRIEFTWQLMLVINTKVKLTLSFVVYIIVVGFCYGYTDAPRGWPNES